MGGDVEVNYLAPFVTKHDEGVKQLKGTDTVACITGGIAEVMFEVPDDIAETARSYLTDDLVEVVDRFVEHVGT